MRSRGVLWMLVGSLAAAAGCAPRSTPVESSMAGRVEVVVTEQGFTPAVVTVPRGMPATIVFTRKTDQTCATEAVFAALGGRRLALPLDKAVTIELPAERPDSLTYACGMEMFSGSVVSR